VTGSNGGKSSTELRRDVQQARSQLAGTVGELGQALDDTRVELVRKLRQYAPWAAGALGSLVLVKALRKAKSHS
jgi:hypothetical protein